MSAGISITVDDARFHSEMDSLYAALVSKGKDVNTLLIGQQALLVKTIVNFTPPTVSRDARSAAHEAGEPSPTDKGAGEKAIERDLHHMITEVDSELFNEVGSKYGTKNIDFYRHIDGELVNVRWDNLTANPSNLPGLHKKYQDSRGRPRGIPRSGKRVWASAIVVERGMQAPYIKKVQERVGRWKAKWAYSAHQMGAKFPAYITRHFSSVAGKAFSNWDLANPSGPSVTFGGTGKRFSKDADAIRSAIKFRTRAIVRLTRLVISDYAKDIAKGMRAESHAKKYANLKE